MIESQTCVVSDIPQTDGVRLTPAERQVIVSMRLLQSKKRWCRIGLEFDGECWALWEMASNPSNPRRLRNR